MDRRAILVSGIVQGVGFRPFVYHLARRHGLRGFVQNSGGGVIIELEGEPGPLDRFLQDLTSSAPALARIDDVQWERRSPRGEERFVIAPSEPTDNHSVSISPDIATCHDCVAELFDPSDRRYRYPFLNCTNCGPRLTIATAVPYDRAQTTMAAFTMCDACRAEYEDPNNRRFHAQPIACPVCGPQLQLLDALGRPIRTDDPIRDAGAFIREGRIGALKGLGGFHLCCDATSGPAVAELRRRKQRDEKPFAIMVADLAHAEMICHLGPEERDLLLSPQRPIVLLDRKPNNGIAEGAALRNPALGVMLPYTPLHHLLARELKGRALVMTSGNLADEPIVYRDADVISRLAEVADFFLTHNRPIQLRCDDSVIRIAEGKPLFLRRSRGYTPASLALPVACARPVLALGGEFKSTFALGRDHQAILSHHQGDLDHFEARTQYDQAIAHYERLFNFSPQLLVHDLHPDYASTDYARRRAEAENLACLAVQHHHAHLAGCMAENGLTERVIGVVFDGTGLGTDGTIWGGEFLIGDFLHFERAGHLRCVPMPGGESAIKEPWRMAVSYLLDAGLEPQEFLGRLPSQSIRTVAKMISARLNCPQTSSCGRLFDGLASILGLRDRATHEAQPALELEWLAAERAPDHHYPICFEGQQPNVVDTRPWIKAAAGDLRDRVPANQIARRFHSTLVETIREMCARLRERTGIDAIALSGGVFLNRILLRETIHSLTAQQFRVYWHTRVPPGDGGLCLGQLAIAAAQSV